MRPALVIAALGAGAAAVQAAPAVLAAFVGHPYFAVNQIVLRGARVIEHESVLRAGGLRAGMSIWGVRPALVEERVEALAWVRKAAVRRDFPNRVVVSVAEREPFAIAVVEGLQYLDRTGRVLGPVRPGSPVDLPFITGLEGTHLQGPGVPLLRRALRFIRLCEKRLCGGGVSEVHLDEVHGLVLVPREVPVPVIVGWGRWNGKLDRLERVLAAWEGQESRIGAIDVTLRHSVVVKLREGEPPGKSTTRPGGMPI